MVSAGFGSVRLHSASEGSCCGISIRILRLLRTWEGYFQQAEMFVRRILSVSLYEELCLGGFGSLNAFRITRTQLNIPSSFLPSFLPPFAPNRLIAGSPSPPKPPHHNPHTTPRSPPHSRAQPSPRDHFPHQPLDLPHRLSPPHLTPFPRQLRFGSRDAPVEIPTHELTIERRIDASARVCIFLADEIWRFVVSGFLVFLCSIGDQRARANTMIFRDINILDATAGTHGRLVGR